MGDKQVIDDALAQKMPKMLEDADTKLSRIARMLLRAHLYISDACDDIHEANHVIGSVRGLISFAHAEIESVRDSLIRSGTKKEGPHNA